MALGLDREGKLAMEALGTKAGLVAELDDLAFQAGGGLVGTAMGTAAEFGHGGRSAGLVTLEPLADGIAGAGELAGGGLEAMGVGEGHQLLAQEMVVGAHSVEFSVGALHGGRIAGGARRCWGSSGGSPAAPVAADGSRHRS